MKSAQTTRLGIIGSSGGSALAAASECLQRAGQKRHWVILTDRPCGMAEWASVNAKSSRILPYQSCKSFSQEAATYFRQNNVERILLFYTRQVGEELFGTFETSNIHPSLLPAFPGLGSVAKSLAAKTGLIGATLHRVDAGFDTGPIVHQVQSPIDVDASLALAERISHIQKVLLTLLWTQLPNPLVHALTPNIAAAFSQYCSTLKVDVPISSLPAL